jgi:PAS domain-containing protein
VVGRRLDGRERILLVSGARFVDPDTGEINAIVTLDDITELRRTEEKLERARQIAGIGYWSVDLATGQATWDDETFRVLGVDRATFVPTQDAFGALLHPTIGPVCRWSSDA